MASIPNILIQSLPVLVLVTMVPSCYSNRGRYLVPKQEFSKNPLMKTKLGMGSPSGLEVSEAELNNLSQLMQLLAEIHTINQEWDHAPEGGFRGGGLKMAQNRIAKMQKDLKEENNKKKCRSAICRFNMFMRHMKHVSEARSSHDHEHN